MKRHSYMGEGWRFNKLNKNRKGFYKAKGLWLEEKRNINISKKFKQTIENLSHSFKNFGFYIYIR